ncbi:MAG: Clp protease [Actinomycetia bacterium]|nr:Clp protease [Actinomycetes bacterium]
MFERFTVAARRAVSLAADVARQWGHPAVGPEHLVVGVLREHEGVAAKLLAGYGLDLREALRRLERSRGRGKGRSPEPIPFDAAAKKSIEAALREARRYGNGQVGTEHLLLGLRRSPSANVMFSEGVPPADEVRRDLSALRDLVPPPASTFADPQPQPEPVSTDGCAFCGRDIYEVERMVTNGAGVLICKECAWLAVQTIELTTASAAPVQALSLPPRAFGAPSEPNAVLAITELFDRWSNNDLGTDVAFVVERIRFVAPDAAAVRVRSSTAPHPFNGRVVRVGGEWKLDSDTYRAVVGLDPPDLPSERDPQDDDAVS